jgi:hypothetical protein
MTDATKYVVEQGTPKMTRAKEFFNSFKEQVGRIPSRKEFLLFASEELNMGPKGAQTYYYSIKKSLKEE